MNDLKKHAHLCLVVVFQLSWVSHENLQVYFLSYICFRFHVEEISFGMST